MAHPTPSIPLGKYRRLWTQNTAKERLEARKQSQHVPLTWNTQAHYCHKAQSPLVHTELLSFLKADLQPSQGHGEREQAASALSQVAMAEVIRVLKGTEDISRLWIGGKRPHSDHTEQHRTAQ